MATSSDNLFCHDLPSQPQPEIGRILVTGATGYVGGRLVDELLARGYTVRVMVRADSEEHPRRWPQAEIAVADALAPESLASAMNGVAAAYYLIHSLLLGHKEFESTDAQAARNFQAAAQTAQVKRIIYLGGLGDVRRPLSPHLRSRMQVAEELAAGTVPVTVLRTAVIIGSGSASYEIIEHLVKNLPILPVPYWARTRCQPIGIRDVIKYLVGVLESPETAGRSYDIGGRDILTYQEMLKTLAELLGRRSSSTLRIGDVIDFFRVEDIKANSMLLLRAEMKLGGMAWLQFSIDPRPGKNRLSVNAYYLPRNIFGHIYWFFCLPLHHFIFHSLIRQIEKRS